ncbi:MAG: ATP-binding protein [Anaerolineaceae bacterium]
MSEKIFDLNVEEVLEDWEVKHAVREVIANALDEQVISNSEEIKIFRDCDGLWHIRDFGRGLQIEHFTLKENQEKLTSQKGIIGKFGVGLKDALATFYRRNVEVKILSPYGTFRLIKVHKFGFENIVTLHVSYIDSPIKMVGTDVILHHIEDDAVLEAKSLFLKFSDENIIDSTIYGQILGRKPESARVYIFGVFASDEPNFRFSYNITSLTESMKKKLNRERLNVGRSTYSERVKSILMDSENELVKNALIEQVSKRATGDQSDEMAWIDVSQRALNLLHERNQVTFFTEKELEEKPEIVDEVKSDGYKVVVISEQQKQKLVTQVETGGPEVRTVEKFVQEFNSSFQYKFVEVESLSDGERRIFERTKDIIALVDAPASLIPTIKISETMRLTSDDTEGVWDPCVPAVIIKRSKLNSLADYSCTLLHELAHAISGWPDNSRGFEGMLTRFLGKVTVAALEKR